MSTITTINASDLITNSRAVINTNFSNLNTDKIETSYLDTDTALSANSDTKIATQKAVKAYVDSGGNVNASETAKGIVEEATDAEVTAGTATGGTGAKLFVTPTKLATRLNSEQYLVGAGINSLVKLYYNIHALFTLWTGAVVNDTTTTFTNWVRTDSTKIVIPPLGVMASFESTGLADIIITNPLYSSGSTAIGFTSSNILIMDWWAKYISGTGQADMGIYDDGLASGISYDLYSVKNEDYVGFQFDNGSLYATTVKYGGGGATRARTDISSGLTLTNWNNYRFEFDMGADSVAFYVNGTLKQTTTGSSVPGTKTVLRLGFGRHQTNPVLMNVTAPYISIEMNP